MPSTTNQANEFGKNQQNSEYIRKKHFHPDRIQCILLFLPVVLIQDKADILKNR